MDITAIAIWVMVFALVFYLSLEGGGYEIPARSQLGIIVWWLVLVGAAVGLLPLKPLNKWTWTALGLLLALVVWTAFSLVWSESFERTSTDLGRLAVLLGVLVLAAFSRKPKGTRRVVASVGSAIAGVAIIALLSRLHPAWFSSSFDVATFFPKQASRLSYPLNYWNGLAILLASGIPLVLHMATGAKSIFFRSLTAAALPMMVLTLYLTYSRTGAAVATLGLITFLAMTSDRLPRIASTAISGIGAAVLILKCSQMSELSDGLINTAAARQQGDDLLLLTIAVCAVVGVAQAGISHAFDRNRRPQAFRPSPRQTKIIWGSIAGVVVTLVAVMLISGIASDRWNEFKTPGGPAPENAARLQSFSGSQRYQLWEVSIDQAKSAPIIGTGSGTYEFWHNKSDDPQGFVRDAHSLYLETLAELGIIGLALLLGFLGTVFVSGALLIRRSTSRVRPQLAAAFSGALTIAVAASADWVWELAALPITFMLLASVLLGDSNVKGRPSFSRKSRLAVAVVSIAAIVSISIPLATSTLLSESQGQAESGNLSGALSSARTAQDVSRSYAKPYLQEALILEASGDLDQALVAATKATSLERTNWRTWFVLSRVLAESGQTTAAISDFRRARSLNPHSSIFEK